MSPKVIHSLCQAAISLAALTWIFPGSSCAGPPIKPGLNDLIVLDPQVNEKGLPIAEVDPSGQIDVPPTIHVHPYYYSEDKEYQAQILQGGPTVVVANHPTSGEKLYIDVTLPPGAPRIAYDKHSITYVYPDQRIRVEFPRFFKRQAVVKNLHGQGFLRATRNHTDELKEDLRDHHEQSKLSREIHEAATGAWNVVKGSAATVGNVGAMMIERTRYVVRALPGVQPLGSIGSQLEERGRREQVRQAGLRQSEGTLEFIPTVR